eukprot:TRINITY_DN26665_c0_g1_i1.p1 TRINITY_DN26665_c0_g1~~TRINITY_DN26665_c0_g1_i1.p1  ORF type:complete len:719 (+),score=122.29 TRINITY_DN26665_c0_g1_i1:114-2270(+)
MMEPHVWAALSRCRGLLETEQSIARDLQEKLNAADRTESELRDRIEALHQENRHQEAHVRQFYARREAHFRGKNAALAEALSQERRDRRSREPQPRHREMQVRQLYKHLREALCRERELRDETSELAQSVQLFQNEIESLRQEVEDTRIAAFQEFTQRLGEAWQNEQELTDRTQRLVEREQLWQNRAEERSRELHDTRVEKQAQLQQLAQQLDDSHHRERDLTDQAQDLDQRVRVWQTRAEEHSQEIASLRQRLDDTQSKKQTQVQQLMQQFEEAQRKERDLLRILADQHQASAQKEQLLQDQAEERWRESASLRQQLTDTRIEKHGLETQVAVMKREQEVRAETECELKRANMSLRGELDDMHLSLQRGTSQPSLSSAEYPFEIVSYTGLPTTRCAADPQDPTQQQVLEEVGADGDVHVKAKDVESNNSESVSQAWEVVAMEGIAGSASEASWSIQTAPCRLTKECLSLDTKLQTTTGITRAADLKVGAELQGPHGETVVVSQCRTLPGDRLRDFVHITLESGSTLTATADHRVQARIAGLEYYVTPFGDLKVGMCLALADNAPASITSVERSNNLAKEVVEIVVTPPNAPIFLVAHGGNEMLRAYGSARSNFSYCKNAARGSFDCKEVRSDVSSARAKTDPCVALPASRGSRGHPCCRGACAHFAKRGQCKFGYMCDDCHIRGCTKGRTRKNKRGIKSRLQFKVAAATSTSSCPNE